MSAHPTPAAQPPGIAAATPLDLDLAFSAADTLAAALREAGGSWLDGLRGGQAWQELLAHWLGQLRPELPPALQSGSYSLGLSLVDDREMAALNHDWRQQQGPTDVLAFAAQEQGPGEAPPMPTPGSDPFLEGEVEQEPLELGDIIVSVDTAARQAGTQGHSLPQELLFLASHGLLHLLGWDHPDAASLAAMLARQEALISRTPPSVQAPA